MLDLLRENQLAVLFAVIFILVVGFFLLRPRQRVKLTDSTPIRPHMPARPRAEGRGLAGEAAAATSDVAGELLDARVHDHLSDASGPADDLSVLKGVGPKFAEALRQAGYIRYEQLARLTPAEIERLDQQLGAFRGRIVRDRVVDQAAYLARGDKDGFEQRFGKL